MDANKGSISGIVLDSKEAPVPDAGVTAHNGSTGATRETRTNDRGYYRFAALDSGSYDVRVEAVSLGVSVKDVVVNVGAGVEVNIRLGLNASSERIEADTSSVSVTDASASQVFPREAIRDLPIDGRRFQDFASLAPGAQANAATRNQISFLGQSGVYANTMVDGGDYNEPFLGGIRGSERAMFAFTIPQSAIQEFQVITNGYAAEYGRSTGGIVNAITRAGGNEVHGEAFYQFRNGNLGVDNPFGLSPIERQQQLGGSAGGPIRKDRIFWFGALEGQLASFPRAVRFAQLDSIAANVAPDIRPAYDYFRSLEGPYTQTNNAIAGLGRVDYQFHDASRFTGRFSGSRNLAANAISAGAAWIPQTPDALSNNGTEEDNIRTASAQWTSVLPHLLLNDLRFTYSGEDRARQANSISPTVEAGVIGSFGTRFDLPLRTEDYRLQMADSLTIQRGLHSVVLGTDYSLLHVSQHAGMNQYGAFEIQGSDVRSLLSILSRSGGPGGNRFDDPNVVYRRQAGNAAIDTRANQIALFAQDEWRVPPNLTISYGLRWEGQVNPSPATGNAFLVDNVRAFPFPLGGVDPTRLRSELNQWAPRIAAAWNAGGDGRTVVRASAGTFYGQTPLAFYANALNNFSPAGR
ncbi:MAG: TonB-dependent receptor [Bryobacteraceae bacterium]